MPGPVPEPEPVPDAAPATSSPLLAAASLASERSVPPLPAVRVRGVVFSAESALAVPVFALPFSAAAFGVADVDAFAGVEGLRFAAPEGFGVAFTCAAAPAAVVAAVVSALPAPPLAAPPVVAAVAVLGFRAGAVFALAAGADRPGAVADFGPPVSATGWASSSSTA